jgi:hypothetical protein
MGGWWRSKDKEGKGERLRTPLVDRRKPANKKAKGEE